MRHKVFAIGFILVAVIGSLVFLREQLAPPTNSVNVPSRSAAVDSDSSPKPRPLPARADPANAVPRSAAATIRAAQVSPSQRAADAGGDVAGAMAKHDDAPPEHKATVASAPADSLPPRKSAEELLSAFVTDDPTQVFLPESVRIHAAVQSEPVDPDWGPAASQAMRDYLVAQFGDRFEIAVADCRHDLCELQAASRVGGDANQDMHDFEDAIRLMKQQPWWVTLQFDQQTGVIATSPDGRALLIYFFSRK